MVESLSLGTPVIAYAICGGVPETWLSQQMSPYIKYMPRRDSGLQALARQCERWINERPKLPWTEGVKKIKHPIDYAAAALLRMMKKSIPEL